MDEVLTRKLFRDRYFQSLKPKVRHFQKGGLSSLTPQEKAIYASTLAAPLLQAKGKGIAPALSALGEGIGKLPATILSVEKAKSETGDGVRTLSEQEVKAYNLPTGTIAQMSADGKISIVSKPSAEQIKQIQGGKRVRSILSRIGDDYYKLGKPVGFADMGRIRATLGKVGGSQYAKDYGAFKSRIQQATSFITQAISGAAVSEQEAKRITRLIPQVGDTEATFEAKLNALDSYFADAIAIAENNNADFMTAMEIMESSGAGAQNYLDLTEEVSIKKVGDKIDVTGN
jgi:hypothetical protein